MATTLADVLFAALAIAIAVSQAFILRSTARGMRHAPASADAPLAPPAPPAPPAPRALKTRRAGTALEWAYAIAPAVALIALLAAVWLTMHPATMQVQGVAPGTGL